MTYDQLVNTCCQIMIEEICAGKVRTGIVRCIQVILNWREKELEAKGGE